MPTSLNRYLDPAALDETVVNIRELIESLEEELQNLPYARPDGLYPDMTVGAVIGADSTAQWATRESTGSGTATVRNVQGAVVVQDNELVPVRIAGIASTDANGDALDSVEWTAQTLRAAGSVADMLYSDHVETRVGMVDFGTLTWEYNSNYAYFRSAFTPSRALKSDMVCDEYQYGGLKYDSQMADAATGIYSPYTSKYIYVKDTTYTDAVTFKTAMNGVTCFYVLETPTITPISPALPMTYRVQAGGSESIIVPNGEVSAAPVLTVAEPVNMSTELARIWAAIESLGYTRNTAQLSRPVSLTDIGSIDEVQKDTTDVVEIDTTKEVTE